MNLILITPPAADVVPLAEAKDHMHVDGSLEDARITGFIKAATAAIDGRDGLLGRALINQVWRLTLDHFPAEIELPLPPCQAVSAVVYVDPEGVLQTLPTADYAVFGLLTIGGARVRPAFGKSWPATRAVPEAVAITFTAGFGPNAADVPEPIRTAIKMHAAHLFEHREAVTIGSGFMKETPAGAEELLRPYRVWSF